MSSGASVTFYGDPNASTIKWNIGMRSCPYCGPNVYHSGQCPRVKSVEFHPDGTVKRYELWPEK